MSISFPRPSSRIGCRAVVWSLALLVAVLASAGPALANGGTIQVANQPAGPYEITVFTDPTPIRVGLVDVSVAVQRAGTTEIVRNAGVTVTAEPLDHPGPGATFPATHELATNKLFYAAKFQLPSPGRWSITVEVQDDLGEGTVAFEIEAAEASAFDNPLVWFALAAPPALLLIWLLSRSGRRAEG